MTNQTPEIKLAADLALVLGQRPTDVLELRDAPGCWRVVVDWLLITQAKERLVSGNEKTVDEQIREMKKLYKLKKHES